MDFLTDLILRYGVIFGKRFFAKEKITFLRAFSMEVTQLGYQLDAKLAKLTLSKTRQQNFYNGYIGDLDKADIIICTHYDTDVKYFNLTSKYAFMPIFSKKSYLISLLPMLILFLVSIILNLALFIPRIQEVGLVSIYGLCAIISTLFLFYFIVRYRTGIPNQKNFVDNTSSLILLLNLMKKLDKKQKKNIAFVLLDGGCTSGFGLKMLESYLSHMPQKKILFLDSIGNGDELHIFKPDDSSIYVNNINLLEGNIETQFKDYLLVTSGELDTLNRVKIKHANTRKDDTLSTERIERHTNTIFYLCLYLIDTQ